MASSYGRPSMFCEHCDALVEPAFVFCTQCGTELDREEVIITHYFEQGLEYEKILLFLSKFHGLNMCLRTLKSKLKSYGLRRRSVNADEDLVRRRIRQELEGPGCMSGFRAMWHTLRLEGILVPRNVVERFLREMKDATYEVPGVFEGETTSQWVPSIGGTLMAMTS